MGKVAVEVGEGRAGPPASRLIRPLTAFLFLVLAAGGVGAALVSRQVVTDQEERLLRQRAAEAAGLFSLAASRTQEVLRSVSTLVELHGVQENDFARTAMPTIAAGLFDAMAVVESDGDAYRVLVAEGVGLEPGGRVPEATVPALDRATASGVFVSSPVFRRGETRHVAFASLIPGRPPRTLVYGEVTLAESSGSSEESGDAQAFGDLIGALYVGDRADPEQVLISTPGFDASGQTAKRTVQFGADQWLLVVSPREPLVGSLAERQPWLFLAGGLLAAGLVAGLVEVLLRRRRYALDLVEERTGQLQQSLRELDEAQQQLVRQERLAAIGQLSAAVGHELRNPLGVIGNVMYLLGNRLGRDDPWIDRQLRTGEREVAAATLIVSDLLQFARPREPMFGEVHVPELLDEVLSVAALPDGIELARRWPADLPPVRADRDQLRQVLLNLVTNAYDAMAGSGLLVLEAERDKTGVRITVGDTGTGIDDETRQHLFEPFFTTKTKGIGLGLAVARRIVEAHGGTLAVKSRPGSGSSFTVTVPAANVAAPAVQ